MSRPFIPAPNGASVELIYSQYGEVAENIFHVKKSSPFSLSDLQALRAVVNTWDSTYNSGLRTGVVYLTRIRTKALDSLGSPLEDYTLGTPRAGGAGGTTCPMNVAFCVKFATGLTGRSFRGRWYCWGIPFSYLADTGRVTSGSASTIVNVFTTLISTLASAGYTMCVTSYRFNKAWRSEAVQTPITTAVAIDTALDSQRRRLPGRGRSL